MKRLVGGTVIGAVALLLLLGSGARGNAQEGLGISGHRAADILRDLGHSANVDTDSRGNPLVVFWVRGVKCSLSFYECEGRRCGSVMFRLAVATRDADKPHLTSVNEWNRKNRFGRVYLDNERDPVIEYDVAFTGGETRDQFTTAVGRWETLVRSFRESFF
jgi:hypothetical protein